MLCILDSFRRILHVEPIRSFDCQTTGKISGFKGKTLEVRIRNLESADVCSKVMPREQIGLMFMISLDGIRGDVG